MNHFGVIRKTFVTFEALFVLGNRFENVLKPTDYDIASISVDQKVFAIRHK